MPSRIQFARSARSVSAALWLAVLLLAGCATINPYDPKLEPPVPEAYQPPREMNKVCLPAYRIEPPDMIQIEMLKLIPRPPYRAEVFDVLQIRANTPPENPIDNYYMVEAEGTINLGPVYGTVRVAGMTIEEIRATLNKWLTQWLREPAASVQLSAFPGAARQRPVPGWSRRHDQPPSVRRRAYRRQDRPGSPHRHPEAFDAVPATRRNYPLT